MFRSVWSHLDVANLSRCRLWKKLVWQFVFKKILSRLMLRARARTHTQTEPTYRRIECV